MMPLAFQVSQLMWIAGYSQISATNQELPRIAIVIPARLNSERLPGKVLLDIRELPMLEHVRRRSNLNKYGINSTVLSGDTAILDVTRNYGGSAFESIEEHLNGLSRVGEYARLNDYDYYVIVQGDEILLLPRHLDALISHLYDNPNIQMVNCVTAINNESEIHDESIVKCIKNSKGEILYIFRKTPLTCEIEKQRSLVLKINGLFAISKNALELATTSSKQPIEENESIEQMKLIELGIRVNLELLDTAYPSINLKRDVSIVEETFDRDPEQHSILVSILN